MIYFYVVFVPLYIYDTWLVDHYRFFTLKKKTKKRITKNKFVGQIVIFLILRADFLAGI